MFKYIVKSCSSPVMDISWHKWEHLVEYRPPWRWRVSNLYSCFLNTPMSWHSCPVKVLIIATIILKLEIILRYPNTTKIFRNCSILRNPGDFVVIKFVPLAIPFGVNVDVVVAWVSTSARPGMDDYLEIWLFCCRSYAKEILRLWKLRQIVCSMSRMARR